MADREIALRTKDSPAKTELQGVFPAILVRAGKAACFAADEFFSARISNPHTRTAYAHQVSRFLAWCEEQGLELRQVTPGQAGRFLDELPGAAPTKNQALAALRHFFDVLVARHAALLNPFHSVRGVRHPFGEGRTPEATVEQARRLLASIQTDNVYGLRDRAVLGTLIYTGARVGAISRLRMQDLRDNGNHRSLQFSKKGGKSREVPVRHDLDEWIAAYLEGCSLTTAPKTSPLFRAGQRRGSPLTDRAMSPLAVQLMLKRRLRAAGLPKILSSHSFRVLVVTDLLSQNVPLEDVQYLAGHAHPRTTQVYDRRRRRVSRNLVERISV
jgi:site-specific recombinase XerD